MTSNRAESDRLLSVQSHVVSGFVGNRSATFPLQLLGWDVDVINTVQFSNHTGYGRWGGIRFDENQIKDLFDGLRKNGLARYSKMLSGYMPSPGVVSCVKEAVSQLRETNPQLIYMLDPVMGDIDRGMYVNPEVLPIYKSMLPLATVISPNQFEAQILAEQEITSLETLFSVLRILHTKHGAPHVLITSVSLPKSDLESLGISSTSTENDEPLMLLIGSSYLPAAKAQELGRSKGSEPSTPSLESGFQSQSININNDVNNEHEDSNQSINVPTDEDFKPWFIQFPEIEGYFSGVGDTFAALTLGRFNPNLSEKELNGSPSPIARATELSIASLQGILKNTMDYVESSEKVPERNEIKRMVLEDEKRKKIGDGEGDGRNDSKDVDESLKLDEEEIEKLIENQLKVETSRRRELRIVQSRNEIENPKVRYRAKWLKVLEK